MLALLANVWSLGEPFLAEDFERIVRIHGHGDTPLAWIPTLDEMGQMIFFRPGIEMSFGLDLWLWGASAPGFHITNLLLFSSICALTSILAWRLTGEAYASCLAGVLLAISPITPEVVVWISGRGGMLPMVTVLLACLSALNTKRPRLLLLCPLLLLLGLFCKEWVVAMVPVLIAFRFHALGCTGSHGFWNRSREAVRSTALLWIALAFYLLVRTLAKGEFIGGYGSGGLVSEAGRGAIIDRLDYLQGLILQIREADLSGWPRYLLAAAVVLVVYASIRVRSRASASPIPEACAVCVAWIAAMMTIHIPVVLDAVQFADVRHLFPALPPTCLLIAIAISTWPSARAWITAGVLSVFGLGLYQAAAEWHHAGIASEAFMVEAAALARRSDTGGLIIHGVPPTIGRARFGVAIDTMFLPPFYPTEAPRVEVRHDLLVPHRGLRRATSFFAMLSAIREPDQSVSLAFFDPGTQRLRSVADPEIRYELRGRLESTGSGSKRLACTDVDLQLPLDLLSVANEATELRLRGRFQPGSQSEFLVEEVAPSPYPILTIHRDSKEAATTELLIKGPPGSLYSVVVSNRHRTLPLPGFGVVLVDSVRSTLMGYLNHRGLFSVSFDLARHQPHLPFVQAVLFTTQGKVLLSRCLCGPR